MKNKNPNKLEKEGKAAFKKGNFIDAQKIFFDAEQSYLANGDNLAAAEMANNRGVALLQAGDAITALEVVDGTDDTFAEAGDTRRQALAIGNKAAALEELGSLEEAAEAYETSSNLLKEIGESDLRASVMQSLSAVQLKQGLQLQSLATMKSGLESIKHPNPKQRLVKKLLQVPFSLFNRK